MISIVAIIRIRPDQADAAADVLAGVARAVGEDEPGALAYTVSRSQADPAEFTVFELYSDAAALDHHRSARAYTSVQAPLRTMLDGAPHVIVADVVTEAR